MNIMRFFAALLLCLSCIAQDKAHDAILQKDGIRNALLYDQAIKAKERKEREEPSRDVNGFCSLVLIALGVAMLIAKFTGAI